MSKLFLPRVICTLTLIIHPYLLLSTGFTITMGVSNAAKMSESQNMDQSKITEPILVVGAGLGGLGIACGLSQLGFNVHLVEKQNYFKKMGATFGLSPNGVKAIEDLAPGIEKRIQEIAIRTPANGFMLPWWQMRQVLIDYVKDRPSVTFHMGLNLTEIEEDDNGVCLRFSNSAEELRGVVCIGADGVHSTVRSLLNLPPAVSNGGFNWRGWLNCSEDQQLMPLLDQGVAPLGRLKSENAIFLLFNYHPKIPGIMCWVCSSKSIPEEEDASEIEIVKKLMFENSADFEVPKEMDFVSRILKKMGNEQILRSGRYVINFPQSAEMKGWGGKNRVMILGDAAHAMEPVDGLGGSMAFEDGVVICRLLSQKLSAKPFETRASDFWSTEKCQSLVSQYEQCRFDRVQKIHENQKLKSQSRFKGKSDLPGSEEFLKWVYSGI